MDAVSLSELAQPVRSKDSIEQLVFGRVLGDRPYEQAAQADKMMLFD
jgi:hypothetical protein